MQKCYKKMCATAEKVLIAHDINLTGGLSALYVNKDWFTTQTARLLPPQALTQKSTQVWNFWLLGTVMCNVACVWICFRIALSGLEMNFQNTLFSHLYTIIIFFFRRRGGWRLYLHIVTDRRLPLPLGILLSSACPTLWLHLFTTVEEEKNK